MIDNGEERILELERRIKELEEKKDPSAQRPFALALGQYNPLVTREAGRIILELPFDDSLDASFPLECFFQMPTQTRAIKSAKIWVQRKPFRQYNTASASGSGSGAVTSGGSAHSHSISNSGGALTDAQASHDHTDPQGGTTGLNGAHQHIGVVPATPTGIDSPAHTHSIDGTAISVSVALTPGIFEAAPAGTMDLYVADDGVNYGTAVVTGSSDIAAQALSGLTKAPGDKRIRINATGLMRVQVLIVLDLRISVLG